MKKLITAAVITAFALAALLAYSLERTAWLFGLFEQSDNLAVAAAVVVELAAVALLAGAGAIAAMDTQARAWANRALLAVLSVQALANLSAGYLRGGQRTLTLFGNDQAAYAVAAVLWLVTNLAVPGLILCLSKLMERLLAHIAATPRLTDAVTATASQLTAVETISVPVSAAVLPVYTAILDHFDRNPTATTADLSAATGLSDRTMEARRAQLVRLGALHRTPDGYRRNGVELIAED